MAPLPKKKRSRANRTKKALRNYSLPSLLVCPNCGSPTVSHQVCRTCGYYKQNPIFTPKQKTKVTKVKEQ